MGKSIKKNFGPNLNENKGDNARENSQETLRRYDSRGVEIKKNRKTQFTSSKSVWR